MFDESTITGIFEAEYSLLLEAVKKQQMKKLHN
jgi:hypothetical protein